MVQLSRDLEDGGILVNVMENNELLMKLMLVLVRDRGAMQGMIRSAGWLREYGRLPEHLGVHTLSQMKEEDIAALAESVGIRKAPANARSDIFLNEAGYALYTFSLRSEVLVQDAARSEMKRVCERVNVSIDRLDELANNAASYQGYKDVLSPVLEYLMFTGSEQGDSMFPAECIIDYSEPLNTNTWRTLYKDEAIDYIWDHLRVRFNQGSNEEWVLNIHVEKIGAE